MFKTYKCNLQFILSCLALIYSIVLYKSSYFEITAWFIVDILEFIIFNVHN
jgi:hypothetical protein